ncbi:MAG TPA: nitroreductase family protein [Porticoccaceae bacterium]|nr:nitroreductase family protein [Gammaproteobacteria bacterium]HIL60609.1 nitroreductase family protein [Porticoccaceae bacterium]
MSSETSNEMNVFDVMYNCRAMRRLDSKEVPQETLTKLVDAANQAPSGSNMQNGRWIIATDPAVRQKLADLNRQGVEAYIQPDTSVAEGLPHQSAGKRQRMLDSVLWQMEHMHEIPALVIACLEYGQKVSDADAQRGGGSIWPGVQNLLLAARAHGLGAAPTTLGLQNQDAVRSVLNMPDTMAALCLIPVGYPLGKFGTVTRKPVGEILRFNTWDA